jgi:hypothetical protein
MYCPHCGISDQKENAYCKGCGKYLYTASPYHWWRMKDSPPDVAAWIVVFSLMTVMMSLLSVVAIKSRVTTFGYLGAIIFLQLFNAFIAVRLRQRLKRGRGKGEPEPALLEKEREGAVFAVPILSEGDRSSSIAEHTTRKLNPVQRDLSDGPLK